LEGCSGFKVEYTYDDPREIPVYTADDTGVEAPQPPFVEGDVKPDPLQLAVDPTQAMPFVRPVNWQTVPDGEIKIWTQLSQPDDRTHPYRWPQAIRITLQAWDRSERLDEPVSYVITHYWPVN
jgi:hypothetical protein